jgi:zinc resistance-associated protein
MRNSKNLRNGLIVLVSIAMVGFAVNAFAHDGRGRGRGNGWGDCDQGYHHGEGYGPMWTDNLSDKEITQLKAQQEKFYNDTKELRDNLYNKERDLHAEFAKDKPDTVKAAKLQKEISGLQAQFDQKRVAHMIEMKKVNPNIGRGYDREYGRGHMHGGPMMGYGGRGAGPCWQ